MSQDPLPRLDEHASVVAAAPDVLWRAAAEEFERSFSGWAMARYARAVGAEPGAAGGAWPLAEGAAVPGFGVVSAVPGRELHLAGRHRFSDYKHRAPRATTSARPSNAPRPSRPSASPEDPGG
jgi:hypothetical protein